MISCTVPKTASLYSQLETREGRHSGWSPGVRPASPSSVIKPQACGKDGLLGSAECWPQSEASKIVSLRSLLTTHGCNSQTARCTRSHSLLIYCSHLAIKWESLRCYAMRLCQWWHFYFMLAARSLIRFVHCVLLSSFWFGYILSSLYQHCTFWVYEKSSSLWRRSQRITLVTRTVWLSSIKSSPSERQPVCSCSERPHSKVGWRPGRQRGERPDVVLILIFLWKAFIFLHFIVLMESDRNSCVKNQKKC